MHQNINPKAPPMTEAEFGHAKQIYFERCAGCHGVAQGRHRQAADTGHHPGRGTEYLKTFIKYGSPAGMPNWGLPAS
jgi:nitrite reductase (NO-forming)/hydroxylamine reductase